MILVSSGVTEGVRKFPAEDRDRPDRELEFSGPTSGWRSY